ncbi:radical SAM protein [Ruminococcaceae bacterium OttesenSCG-928-L11]|nr:radical SAM protein [Ruminococcaceae bacterium OttesenSCG-928-L11]
MKWNNPGHEFDEIGEFFCKSEIYVWGLGETAADLVVRMQALGIDIKAISDYAGWQLGWMGIEVAPSQRLIHSPEGKIVVLCLPQEEVGEAVQRLECVGYEKGKTYFFYYEFIDKWLSIYAVYSNDKVYFKDICFIPSTKCNLKCAACLNFTTYLKKMHDEPLNELIAQVDLFFTQIDYIGLFHVSGGEPVLYPHLGTLLAYINANYRSKIHQLATTTNGTTIYTDELCTTLRENNVTLICDDYTDQLPEYRERFDALRARLERNGVWHFVNKVESWIDLAPDRTDNSAMSDDQLISYCTSCDIPFREYCKGRIYACNYANYAEKAELCQGASDEFIDLGVWPVEKKKELIEFRLGYTPKGYVEFCKKCAGFKNNPYSVPPAVQLKQ